MEASELTFDINGVIALAMSLITFLGVWFGMKGKQDLMSQRIIALEKNDEATHNRIDILKKAVELNKEKNYTDMADIKKLIMDYKVEILTAIGKIKK